MPCPRQSTSGCTRETNYRTTARNIPCTASASILSVQAITHLSHCSKARSFVSAYHIRHFMAVRPTSSPRKTQLVFGVTFTLIQSIIDFNGVPGVNTPFTPAA